MANVIRLFDPKTEVYTDLGRTIDAEIYALFRPLLQNYRKAGYAMRDIAYILTAVIDTECSAEILVRNHKSKTAI